MRREEWMLYWYIDMWKNATNFDGRSRRKAYWMVVLVNFVISFILATLSVFFWIFDVITTIYCIALILPGISLGIRRLHDIGKSGWWLLIGFVPIIGAVVLLIFYCMDSVPGENEYGPNPKEVDYRTDVF